MALGGKRSVNLVISKTQLNDLAPMGIDDWRGGRRPQYLHLWSVGGSL